MGARERAKDVLNHYIQMIMTKQGLMTDSDTTSEIDSIVDDIVQAAAEEAKVRIVAALQELVWDPRDW